MTDNSTMSDPTPAQSTHAAPVEPLIVWVATVDYGDFDGQEQIDIALTFDLAKTACEEHDRAVAAKTNENIRRSNANIEASLTAGGDVGLKRFISPVVESDLVWDDDLTPMPDGQVALSAQTNATKSTIAESTAVGYDVTPVLVRQA